nr:cytochrome c oxidase subunit II [Phenylobacterium glaciei]
MTAFWGLSALAAEELVGQPTPGAINLQPGVTPLRDDAIFFHDKILLPIITLICLLVLGLMIWIVVRYNKRSNPIPAKWSHNTPIEIIWTVLPVLILMGISIFSFKLLFAYHDMPKPYMTVKATGYQWYWGFEYPDNKIGEYVSNILPEDEAKAKNVPYRLAATEPLVVPVNQVVRVLVTGADVIHAFAVPSFGVITDAVPGRVNETWFKVDRPGIYYGSCRELCGVDHAFMPIEVHAVSQAEYDAWVAKKGGSAVGAKPEAPAAADAAVAVSATAPAPASPMNPAAPAPAPATPTSTPPAPVPAPAAH